MNLNSFIEVLRGKWKEVPGGDINRVDTSILSRMDDLQLYKKWKHAHENATTGTYFGVRGWYQALYKDVLKEKKVLDVGSGFGIDGIFFAQHGAQVTFLDIVESNLNTLSKICNHLKLTHVDFVFLENMDVLKNLGQMYDVIWCQGSLLNAPFEMIRHERRLLLEYLPINGRWIELSYPKSRWVKEGQLSFDRWGEKTDGGAPWVEWYDLEKLMDSFYPALFDVVLSMEFYHNDFIWFDLIRRK